MKPEDGTRYCIQYRQENLYVVKTDKSVTLSMADIDDQRTLTGLDLIGNLLTVAMEHGVPAESLAVACFEASRLERDLAAQLSKILEER